MKITFPFEDPSTTTTTSTTTPSTETTTTTNGGATPILELVFVIPVLAAIAISVRHFKKKKR